MTARFKLIFILISLFLYTHSAFSSTQNETISLEKIRIIRHQAITMRDGIRLFGDVYLPDTPGQYPTLVTRTPYGVQRDGMHTPAIRYAQNGYAVVVVDVRGRYESEGEWEPFRDEAKDGYDIIEWAAVQSFSNGKIGTYGGSYGGHNQWRTIGENPPHLVASFPSLASTNIFANWLTQGGAFRLSFNYGWGVVRMPDRIMLPQYWHTESYSPEELKYETILKHLPLKDGDLQSAGYAVSHYRDWLAHEKYDDYWRAISDEENFSKMTVPVYTLGGWFDIFITGTINGYVGMKNKAATSAARNGTRMIIGPWGHGASRSFGDVDFTQDAMISQFETELKWFDFHLKGIQNGLGSEDPVRLFYMGANQWRSEKDWPIPGTKYQEVFLTGGGHANTLRGDGQLSFNKPVNSGTDQYVYDPNNPVETHGGNNCCGTPTIAGPRDQRPIEQREDVLVYTSEILKTQLTIAGNVRFKMYASTDGPDTDWMIKLTDVYPDGTSMPISEGMLRAKFREGLDQIKLLKPGEVYAYDIELTGTANVFKPGHRIRIDITSSNFPQFDRNPNTGEPLGSSSNVRIARQKIHHGGTKASAIILPVVSNLE
jgi:putative CocE/NonD family hydrolase